MPSKLKDFLNRWSITTVAVLVAAHTVKGIHYDKGHWSSLLVATLVLGLLNAFLRPLLLLLSLPLLVVTLGLFTLVINALLLYLVGQIIQGFYVESFGAAFWGGLVISVVALLLNSLTGSGNTRVHFHRGKPRPPSDQSGGDGPTIDV